MTLSLVREEPDEVESLMSVSEAESGEAIPRLRLTIPLSHFVGLYGLHETNETAPTKQPYEYN